VISPEQTAREKDRLPRGWGRFGKSIDALAGASEPSRRCKPADRPDRRPAHSGHSVPPNRPIRPP
jgi:hypothetical protein